MFVHVKSPMFRNEVTDLVLKCSRIEGLDILKKFKKGEICFVFVMFCDGVKGSEIHPTLESAQNRMEEVLKLCGETEERAKEISSQFLPEDKIEKSNRVDLGNIISKAIFDSLDK